jgi:enoyl-CoA hydratase/carnithine racemase
MSEEILLVERDGAVATLTLNRPQVSIGVEN